MLVSIGLPVFNGADRMGDAVRSVLEQDHADIELVISDNASTDHTEEYCRELARADSRVVYHRQPGNVGVVGNFEAVLRLSRGTFFRWMGDDDLLEPHCVSRSLEVFAEDERLILVTSQTRYTGPDGQAMTPPTYRGTGLLSDDPVDRFTEMMVVHTQEHMLLDPLYAMMRREAVARVPRPVMLREDEVYAVMLALAGPWGHVPEVLAHRGLRLRRLPQVARTLGVPQWTVHFATTLQFAAVVRHLRTLDLTPEQRRRAWGVVARMYARRQHQTLSHRTRKAARLALATVRR
ncbi:glycosyltransferase [Microbispora sp. CA-135349]|uniref:glycosyltransferase family 2 protein n=1 Tax=Microbispora sp. CA-135349 TaxID=3239953 RepID=UPI003D92ADFB